MTSAASSARSNAPTSTYGSRGIARYRVYQLERAGHTGDSEQVRAALGRYAALVNAERPMDLLSAVAYDDEMQAQFERNTLAVANSGMMGAIGAEG